MFEHSDGTLRPFPPKEHAIKINSPWYINVNDDQCEHCGMISPPRYVNGDHCRNCVINQYVDIANHLPANHRIPSSIACRNGPHVKVTLAGSTKCTICQGERITSPRQQAIANGQKWYMPDQPCPRCEQRALKHVYNSRCQGCYPPKPNINDVLIPPGTIVDRQTATALGFTVYRSGVKCRHDHIDPLRWTASGNCVECSKQ